MLTDSNEGSNAKLWSTRPKDMSIDLNEMRKGTELLKRGFAKMQEGGVIMDVVTPEQAHIAEDAGAASVMALERVPADIRADGGVARMSHPDLINGIIETTSIPVMAKARIGHDEEARVLEALGVDMVDESEVLTPADPFYHIAKNEFTIPFVCGCTNLGEAVRRIMEGAAMIRTKGEAGTGNVVAAVQHARLVASEIELIQRATDAEFETIARTISDGFRRLEKASEHALTVENTPFGSMAANHDSIVEMMTQCGLHLDEIYPRILHVEKVEAFVKALQPALSELGVDSRSLFQGVAPIQYVVRASLKQRMPFHLDIF